MELIWLALAGGAAAFPHCLGMCGGFALHLCGDGAASEGAPGGRGALFLRQILWHAGRIATYSFLGALAGFFGGIISLASWPWAGKVLGYGVGGVMILMGLSLVGLLPLRPRRSRTKDDRTAGTAANTAARQGSPQAAVAPGAEPAEGAGLFAGVFGNFFARPTAASAFVLGLANGFLPCPVTLAFLALAAGRGSVLLGMAILAAMGAGTVWALLLLGLTGQAVRSAWRRGGVIVVGVLLLAMGGWTILRKAGILPPLPGMTAPAQPAGTATSRSCCN